MSDFVALFDTIVVRKDQVISVQMDDDFFTNAILNENSDEKNKFYLVTVKTECLDCDLVKRYDSRYEALSEFKRISHELGVLFSGESRCDVDPRLERERKQFVTDV